MDLDEAITITQLNMENGVSYAMIGWQANSFEMYLYSKEDLWVGKFSHKRLSGFSKNLNMTENAYYTHIKKCLSEQKSDYCYELKGGFFYWKRKWEDHLFIEGFMPVELNPPFKRNIPDLIEVLIAINKQLKHKIHEQRVQYDSAIANYETCLKNTEDFFKLRMNMEKTLYEKFLSKIHSKKSEAMSSLFNDANEESKIMINVVSREAVSNKTSITSLLNDLNNGVSKFYITTKYEGSVGRISTIGTQK